MSRQRHPRNLAGEGLAMRQKINAALQQKKTGQDLQDSGDSKKTNPVNPVNPVSLTSLKGGAK